MRNKDGSIEQYIPTPDPGTAVAVELECQLQNNNQAQEEDIHKGAVGIDEGYDHKVAAYMSFMAQIQPEILHAPMDVLRNRATGWYIENYTQSKI